jgi:ribonuclease-3
MTRRHLLDALGAELSDDLLTLALTHRSYAYENGGLPTNERLELLGDAVLGLVIVDELFRRHPDSSEGDLAKLRNSIVNSQALAGVARDLTDDGLGEFLLLGRGEVNTGGHGKASILADTLESLLGAVYLEHGLEGARAVILRLFDDLLDTAPTLGAALEWKSSLQELTAARGLGVPRYDVSSEGPDHDRRFTAVVFINGEPLGSGVGRSKKAAETDAAAQAWTALDAETDAPGADDTDVDTPAHAELDA